MTTKYRVTMTTKTGKRIATSKTWDSKADAEEYARQTISYRRYLGSNARVVKDSERVRRMIP